MIKLSKYKLDSLICSIGRLSTGLITFLLLPLYLPLLGDEAYGLFGLFASVSLFFAILEGGLGSVLVRDITKIESKSQDSNSLIRSFEYAYLIFGGLQCLVSLIIIKLGFFDFITASDLSRDVISKALIILSLQFIYSGVTIIHDSVMVARAQHSLLVSSRLFFVLLSGLGSYAVLKLTHGNVIAFFQWWTFSNLAVSILKAVLVWRSDRNAFFKSEASIMLLKPYAKTQGMLIVAAFASYIYSQQAIWLAASLLPLAQVGLLTLAQKFSATIGQTLNAMSRPLVAQYTKDELNSSGHLKTLRLTIEVIGVISVCVAAVFVFHHESIYTLWLGTENQSFLQASIISAVLLAASAFRSWFFPVTKILQSKRKLKGLMLMWVILAFALHVGIKLFSPEYGLLGITGCIVVVASLEAFVGLPLVAKYNGIELSLVKIAFTLFAPIALFALLISALMSKLDFPVAMDWAYIATFSGLLCLVMAFVWWKFCYRWQSPL